MGNALTGFEATNDITLPTYVIFEDPVSNSDHRLTVPNETFKYHPTRYCGRRQNNKVDCF
jgi:hypothetical protein